MGISGIGAANSSYALLTGKNQAAQNVSAQNTPAQNSAAQNSAASGANAYAPGSAERNFLDYMKKSPGQRMIETWLKAHHLTQAQLDAMPPAQRDAVLKQMAQDIKNEIDRQTAESAKGKTDLLV